MSFDIIILKPSKTTVVDLTEVEAVTPLVASRLSRKSSAPHFQAAWKVGFFMKRAIRLSFRSVDSSWSQHIYHFASGSHGTSKPKCIFKNNLPAFAVRQVGWPSQFQTIRALPHNHA